MRMRRDVLRGALVEVNVTGAPRVFYGRVSRDIVHRIVEEHVSRHRLVDDYIFDLGL
jgi:(2Fe-2S) ferredoxin